RQGAFTAENHHGSRFHLVRARYIEILGTVGVRENNVSANTKLTTDPDMTFEEARMSLSPFLLGKNGGTRTVRVGVVCGDGRCTWRRCLAAHALIGDAHAPDAHATGAFADGTCAICHVLTPHARSADRTQCFAVNTHPRLALADDTRTNAF